MRQTAHDIIEQHRHGQLSEAKALAELEKLNIRGGFSKNTFTGYDYERKTFVESHEGITVTEER